MSGSAVDAALAALASTFSAVAPADTKVFDGEPVDPPRKFLCVGWDESEQPAVIVTRAMGDAAGARNRDTYEVSSLLSCWAGNRTGPVLRAETFDLFDLFDAAIDADRRLGGVVMMARTRQYEYLPNRRPEGGVIAQIRFTTTLQVFK